MNTTQPPSPEQLDQLMVDAVTQGLAPQDEAALADAIARDPALRIEAERYELAATAVELALAKPDATEPVPDALRQKLLMDAAAQLQAKPALKLAGDPPSAPGPTARFVWTDGRYFGWYAAAAALIALCVVLLQPNQPNTSTAPDGGPVVVAPDTAAQYARLATRRDTVKAQWQFNAENGEQRFADASGEVIWNPDKQAGFMKLAGLPVNDPTKEQYQLWIVDPLRDDEPIDGGVFDVTAKGEVIVPIDAKLRSDTPAVFAITVEKPGGVVVSEGPLQVVAAVQRS